MWTEAAISSTVTGCAKCARIQHDRLADSLDARLGLTDLRHPRTDRRTQQTDDDLVDDERPEHLRLFRVGHQVEQSGHRIDDAVGRVADVETAHVRRLANAVRKYPRGEFSDTCGIKVEDETEIRLFPAGSNHLARNREIDSEDEHMVPGRIRATSRPTITTLAPCATMQSAGRMVAYIGSVVICESRTTNVPGRRSGNAPSCGA